MVRAYIQYMYMYMYMYTYMYVHFCMGRLNCACMVYTNENGKTWRNLAV